MTTPHETHLPAKKLRERKAVDALRDIYKDFPDGRIEATEEPDFIVHAGSGAVGIEITEYFRPETIEGSPIQEQESLCHQIANVATRRCTESAVPNLYVAISFERARRIVKGDVVPVAEAIVKLVRDRAADVGWSLKIANDGQLPECIDDILMYRPEGLTEPFVGFAATTWVPPVAEDQLKQSILSKEKKLDAYRRRCSQVWLAIVIDGFRVASLCELPAEVSRVATAFDRVIVLHDWRQAIELSS
jgi:hypothetical protein